jgi:hypothetical protein
LVKKTANSLAIDLIPLLPAINIPPKVSSGNCRAAKKNLIKRLFLSSAVLGCSENSYGYETSQTETNFDVFGTVLKHRNKPRNANPDMTEATFV